MNFPNMAHCDGIVGRGTRGTSSVNIAAGSMGDAEQDPAQFDPRRAADVAAEYPDIVVGIKTAHYWTRDPWDDAHTPWASVDAAVDAGARADRPVMVDFWPRPPSAPTPTRSSTTCIRGTFTPTFLPASSRSLAGRALYDYL